MAEITSLHIKFRSVAKINQEKTPDIFDTGMYILCMDKNEMGFAFETTQVDISFKDGFMYIECKHKDIAAHHTYEDFISDPFTADELCKAIKNSKMSHYTQVYHECKINESDPDNVDLAIEKMVFYDNFNQKYDLWE